MTDFTTKLLDFADKEIMGLTIKDGVQTVGPATLGSVATDALANCQLPLSTDEKIRAYKLASSGILTKPNATLAAESVALLKKAIGAAQTPIVVGRCFEILDPASMVDEPAPTALAE